MKVFTTCMNCGKKEVRNINQDELGTYIVCDCGSSCDVDVDKEQFRSDKKD